MSKLVVDTIQNTSGSFSKGVENLGPSTNYGDVGTYGYFINVTAVTSMQAGTRTVAGSDLRPHGSVGGLSASYDGNHHWPEPNSNSPAGTWRNMGGFTRAWSGMNRQVNTLYVRIS